MKNFTVIIARPDYLQDETARAGTRVVHIKAKSIADAIATAKIQAYETDHRTDGEDLAEAADYEPIAVFHGHHDDLLPDFLAGTHSQH